MRCPCRSHRTTRAGPSSSAALRSDEREVRIAAVTALGRLGDTPRVGDRRTGRGARRGQRRIRARGRRAARPPRAAPGLAADAAARAPERRRSLLRGPASRALSATRPTAMRRTLMRDPSPARPCRPHSRRFGRRPRRGAARRAARSLDDPHPLVRAHACRTASAIAGRASAPFVAPLLGDASWWVREAAREALVAVGREVAPVVAPLLESDDATLRQRRSARPAGRRRPRRARREEDVGPSGADPRCGRGRLRDAPSSERARSTRLRLGQLAGIPAEPAP